MRASTLPLWLWAATLLLLLGGPADAQFATPKTWNVVLILTDDYTQYEMPDASPHGTAGYTSTPNLATLAANGVTFTRFYAAPICGTSRASLFAGANPAHHRVTSFLGVNTGPPVTGLHRQVRLLPRAVKHANPNYRVGIFGKYGAPYASEAYTDICYQGWDVMRGAWGPAVGDYTSWPETYIERNPDGRTCTHHLEGVTNSSKYLTDATTENALAWIAAQEALGRPWVAVVNPHSAHSPYHHPAVGRALGDGVTCGADPDEDCYKEQIEDVDSELSEFYAALDLTNTLICLWGDNGASDNFNGGGKNKSTMKGVNAGLVCGYGPVGGTRGRVEATAMYESGDLLQMLVALAGSGTTSVSESWQNRGANLVGALLEDSPASTGLDLVLIGAGAQRLWTGRISGAYSAWALTAINTPHADGKVSYDPPIDMEFYVDIISTGDNGGNLCTSTTDCTNLTGDNRLAFEAIAAAMNKELRSAGRPPLILNY